MRSPVDREALILKGLLRHKIILFEFAVIFRIIKTRFSNKIFILLNQFYAMFETFSIADCHSFLSPMYKRKEDSASTGQLN
jgi:hypothetical protein